MTRTTAAIILAAGQSTRMKSAKSKVLHEIGGRSLFAHVLATCESLKLDRIAVVSSPDGDDVRTATEGAGAISAVQDPPLGTGHAVLAAKDAVANFKGDLVVLYADTPLIEPGTIEQMFSAREDGADLVVLGFRAADPAPYGRLVMDGDKLARIVEAKDATAQERKLDFVNSGVMVADTQTLLDLLSKVTNKNANGEYYLTDVIGLANDAGLTCSAIECPEEEVLGVNSRIELAAAEAALQKRLRVQAIETGATMVAPETVFLSFDTELAPDCWIGPNVVFGPGVKVGEGAVIKSFSHLEGASVGAGAQVGPYARLRPGAKLDKDAKVGNFVEIKKAHIEEGAKVNHLTYIGDARVGAGTNIGAGVITCNYDGFEKHFTDIGEGAFIGSNTSLIAPVVVEAGAYVGSGSVITKYVEEDALALTRPEFKQVKGWAAKFRARKNKSKD